jgi:hypothetical protein
VNGGDPRERGGGVSGLREIFVAIEANCNSDFRFRRRRIVFGRRPDHSQNAAPAAYGHAFSQSDLGRHAESDFDFGAFGERSVSEEEHSARTEVLGESEAFQGSGGLAERERKKIRKPLPGTALKLNWWSGHKRRPSLAEIARKARATLAHGEP